MDETLLPTIACKPRITYHPLSRAEAVHARDGHVQQSCPILEHCEICSWQVKNI